MSQQMCQNAAVRVVATKVLDWLALAVVSAAIVLGFPGCSSPGPAPGPAPTLTLESISPNVAVPDWPGSRVVPVILTVPNLATSSATVEIDGDARVTASDVHVLASGRRIEANFNIAANAAIGDRSVTVRDSANRVSNPLPFTILHVPWPMLTSILPNTGVLNRTANTLVPVFIQGTNFSPISSVQVSGRGVTVSNVRVGNTTQLRATFTIAPNAAIGGREVTITNTPGIPAGGGGRRVSGALPFTVTAGTNSPGLARITPSSGLRRRGVRSELSFFLTGANFVAGSRVIISGGDVTVFSISVTSPTQMSGTFGIPPTAALGARNVTVITPNGETSNPITFTLNPEP